MIPKLFQTLFFSAAGLVLFGCYPQEIESVRELTSVVTHYDEDYDFGSKSTYFLVDSLALYTNIEDPDISEEEILAFQEVVMSEIAAQLEARGFTRLTETQAEATPPDLVVTAAAIATLQDGTAWYPGGGWWWWGYPPGWGWDPWWGWYYPPGWGGYPVYYSYTTGSLLMFIADYENADQIIDDMVPLEWNGAINGLLNNDPTEARIRELIAQAFEQSPYLGTN